MTKWIKTFVGATSAAIREAKAPGVADLHLSPSAPASRLEHPGFSDREGRPRHLVSKAGGSIDLSVIERVSATRAATLVGILVGVMVTLLAGCATAAGECDPSTADFFKNTSCLASGAYGERQRAMQATLAAEQRRNAAFRTVLAELRAEQSQVSSQLGARQSDYARLDAAWRDLKQSLAAETRTNRALASRIAALDGSLQARKQLDSGADLAAKQAKRDDLKLKLSLLERELAVGVYE